VTPDNELPVWPFMPNWRGGVTERLAWGTNVSVSDSGAEQAYSYRLSPRREFEATFNPIGDSRTFFDLFISQIGGQEMMVPLWHDTHKLTALAEEDATRIDCHTEYGEFVAGGMALLVGPDPWSHEIVEIDAVDGTGLDIVSGLSADWPSGATILPLRRSRLDLQPSLSNLTGTVGESVLRFTLNQANDLPDNGEWDGLTLDGYPVVTIETNWAEAVTLDFTRIMGTEDNRTGLTYIRDIAERAFRTKRHVWHLHGRRQNWEFRQFLYRMGGRRVPVWMPTGTRDMVVAATANAGSGNVQVRRVGLTYVGGPKPGRDRFLAKTAEGMQARRITGLGVPSLATNERLNLNSNLTYALPAGTELSFLEITRADGDNIEILHHTDVEGMSECTINFRSFSNTRDPSGSNFVDLPSGTISLLPCGAPEEGDNPCMPAFNAYTRRVVMTHTESLPGYFPGIASDLLPWAVTAGMMPNGRTLPQGTGIGMTNTNFNTADPVDGTPLRGLVDFNNPDGSPGGPIAAGRRTTGPNGGCIGWEWRFYFPITGPSTFSPMHQYSASAFATGGCHQAMYTVYDQFDNILGQYDQVYSAAICAYNLWPEQPTIPV